MDFSHKKVINIPYYVIRGGVNVKFLTTMLATSMIGLASVSAAPIAKDVLVNLTKEDVQVIEELKETMTYREIAEKYDVLEEYQEEVLAAKKTRIEQKVAEGKLTEEEAKEIIENLQNCDGSGSHMQLKLGRR